MQTAKQYRMNYIRKDNSMYLTEDRTQTLDNAAQEAGYLDYSDYRHQEKNAGNALGYIMIFWMAVLAISGSYVAFRCVIYLFTFKG